MTAREKSGFVVTRFGELTSGRRDAAAKRHEGSDVFAQEGRHGLDEVPADAGVATDEGVHADDHGGTDPGFRHAERRDGVAKRQDIGRCWSRRQDAGMLMLEKSLAKDEMLAGAGISCKGKTEK